ncbi:LOW QUALITY PROTEIN: DNA repair protein XRCC1 [Catharus ustulatus]|uniref:LOW QUALITY PROTEIN: DNA repair protein XRCC1 n=1 Tax=Catharus ustulatus TaxID=91951 RepID=UPI00140D327F|nr:LOW QUALITY PROTEIN: DNA repair protein XRCC1 [Catharus ustulatus]
MPEIPLTRVVSVSSADPRHPAENLLRPDDGGRWRGAAAGEKQLSVVLELGDSRPIHSLHIGNDGAAFVEVLGGSSAGGEFQVLLPSAALMSPSESRAGAEPRRVRLFGPESLVRGPSSPGAHLHTWDRLKVVLSQPYCQSRPYGLSFIRVFAAPAEDEAPPRRRLGPFTLREEGEGSPRRPPGALFYQRPSPTAAPPRDPSPGPSYAAAALRGTGSDHGQPPPKKPKPHLDTPKTTPGTPKSHLETTKTSPGTTKTSPGTPKATPGTPKSHLGGSKAHLGGPKPLEGVVLALSGFQNPLRGHLRAAAAALGAQYRPDWGEDCTHLVCAFARTPKASRARQRGGVVVTPEWIWECQRTGKRVTCERYLLRGSASSSSEGEGPDEAPPPPRPSPAKVKKGAEPKEPDTPETPPPTAPATPPESPESDGQSDTDPYGGSTEENSEDEEGEGEPIPQLPDFFQDKTFFFHGEFPAGVERRLLRYVVAFGGTLAPYMDDSVTHVVTAQDWDPAFEEALELRPSLTFVRPHWLLQCGERQRPLPAPPFPRA